jgi:hypothetical protein
VTRIHVLNHEGNAVQSAELDAVCRAIHRQVVEHFGPAWGVTASVTRVHHPSHVPTGGVLAVVQQQIDVNGALAYHTVDGGRPEIVVSAEVAEAYGSSLGECLSHEVLETLGDPDCGTVMATPDGRQWYREACDPVQAGSYTIDGVKVSDFVLPSWFEPGSTGRWSWLGTLTHDHQVDRGGYAQYLSGGRVHQILGRGAEARMDMRAILLGEHTRAARIARRQAA